MNVTCPACGADMDLDVLLSHEESRQALGQLAVLTVPLGKRTLQYIRLFKPATRAMSHGRTVTLLAEIVPDMTRGAITHKGREWATPLDTWSLAFDRMLERRDNGKLVLPLKSHGYLYEVLQGIVDSGEAVAERVAESALRARSVPDESTDLQDIGSALAPGPAPATTTPVVMSPRPAGPSLYAQRLKAEIEADRSRRDGAQPLDGEPA